MPLAEKNAQPCQRYLQYLSIHTSIDAHLKFYHYVPDHAWRLPPLSHIKLGAKEAAFPVELGALGDTLGSLISFGLPVDKNSFCEEEKKGIKNQFSAFLAFCLSIIFNRWHF